MPGHSTPYVKQIICTIQSKFPTTIDLHQLHQIFQDILGPKAFPSSPSSPSPPSTPSSPSSPQPSPQISLHQQSQLLHRLLTYLISLIDEHLIRSDEYRALESHLQKAEGLVRGHIRVEQELKMYLEYLEAKIRKMERQIGGAGEGGMGREIVWLRGREAGLQKEKIQLMKKNQKLTNQIQELQNNHAQQHSQYTFHSFLPTHSTSISIQGKDKYIERGNQRQPTERLSHDNKNRSRSKNRNGKLYYEDGEVALNPEDSFWNGDGKLNGKDGVEVLDSSICSQDL